MYSLFWLLSINHDFWPWSRFLPGALIVIKLLPLGLFNRFSLAELFWQAAIWLKKIREWDVKSTCGMREALLLFWGSLTGAQECLLNYTKVVPLICVCSGRRALTALRHFVFTAVATGMLLECAHILFSLTIGVAVCKVFCRLLEFDEGSHGNLHVIGQTPFQTAGVRIAGVGRINAVTPLLTVH